MEPTIFENCNIIQRLIITRASEVMAYGWSDDFAVKYIRELPKTIIEQPWFKPIDPTQLTEDQMRQLGFRRWSDEDPMMLIPLWILPFLIEEFPGGCIDGEKRIFKREELDNDNRVGCIAYGVITESPPSVLA